MVSHRQDGHVHSQCVCVCVCTYRVIVEGVTLSVAFAVLVGSIHCTLSPTSCVAWGIVLQPFTSNGTPAIHKQWYGGEYLQTLAKLWCRAEYLQTLAKFILVAYTHTVGSHLNFT